MALLLAAAGCAKKAEVTELQRKQAANLASEAEFAMSLRDYARAEPLWEQAATLCPDNGDYAVNLGVARKKQGNVSGAKSAYENALKIYREISKEDPEKANAFLQEIQALALLGRVDDARATLKKAREKVPGNRELRRFEEAGEIDRLIKDPNFKELAL